VIEPGQGNLKLKKAAEICQGTLALNFLLFAPLRGIA
jgi:hypothetical protein